MEKGTLKKTICAFSLALTTTMSSAETINCSCTSGLEALEAATIHFSDTFSTLSSYMDSASSSVEMVTPEGARWSGTITMDKRGTTTISVKPEPPIHSDSRY